MSDPFLKLTEIYRKHADIEVVSGLNSYHFQNWRDAPFTHYFKENIWQTGHLGIRAFPEFCESKGFPNQA
jgi:hypothetical protein